VTIDQGLAAIVAATIGAIVAVITLAISIKTSRGRAYLESRLSVSLGIEQDKRNFLYAQLSEFYDPIFSLLSVNGKVFERIGPISEARRSQLFSDDETAEVWNKLVQQVIIPNNIRICEVIQTKLHLLALEDNVEPYMEFITHAYAYQVFKEKTYEAYKLFRLPQGFFNHVKTNRYELRKRLEVLLRSEHKR
jgi:hypothetical protein